MANKIKLFKIIRKKGISTYTTVDTLEKLIQYHSYTLETGKSYEDENGNSKIKSPSQIKSITSLVSNINKAVNNSAANGYSSTSYSIGEVTDEDIKNYLEKIK